MLLFYDLSLNIKRAFFRNVGKGLGPNQKKVLAYFEIQFNEYKKSFKLTEIEKKFGINIDVLVVVLLCDLYNTSVRNLKNIPIKKRQAIYNAINSLVRIGWVTKSEITDSFMTKPPVNYNAISVRIKDGQIFNHKKYHWKELKHLIGTTVL